MAIKIDTWAICGTCLQYIANHDWSSLSLYMSEEEIDQKKADIEQSLRDLEEDGRTTGSLGDDLGFRKSPCDCCYDDLHGNRYSCEILKTLVVIKNRGNLER